MRGKLIHAYFGVDLKEVWNTAKENVPELSKVVNTILAK